MKKIITLGEIMLRFSPPAYKRIAYSDVFEACYGGGEANVAVSLVNYGMKAAFVSKIPVHDVGEGAIRFLRANGVDTDFIVRGGGRLGTYYLEHGASVRPSKVVYDRAHSAMAEASPAEFDFEKIFAGAHWFHVSGITPALSAKAAQVTANALKCARRAGLRTSFDLNYRKKLWTPEEAQKVCIPLMEYVDVCIGNEEDSEKVLGLQSGSDVTSGVLNMDGYRALSEKLKDKFDFQVVSSTLRESFSASDNGWCAILYDGDEFYVSKKYNLHIVDRVGGGDSFSGGLIYALLAEKNPQQAIDFAAAASALKHSIHGDINQVNLEEAERLANGDASGRVER